MSDPVNPKSGEMRRAGCMSCMEVGCVMLLPSLVVVVIAAFMFVGSLVERLID